MESRKERPPALQLPPDADGPLATLIDNLEEGGSGKKSSGRTIPAERPQMTDRQAAAAGVLTVRLCLGQTHQAADGLHRQCEAMSTFLPKQQWNAACRPGW